MSATPRPWKAIKSPHGRGYLCVQIGTDNSYTTLELRPDDAALIVRAVNNHDDLVEALSNLIRLFGGYQGLELTDAKVVLARAKL